jgi:hypothetical protein
MKLLLFVTLTLVILALSQSPPTITENFEAHLVGSHWNRTDMVQLVEHVFEDLDDKKQRVDTWINGTQISILNRFDSSPPMEYIIFPAKKTCTSNSLAGHTMMPVFSWVKDSHHHGSCRVNFNDGTRWSAEIRHVHVTMCYGDHIMEPLDIFSEDHTDKHNVQFRLFTFENFIPGKPADTTFAVPDFCK